MSVAYTVMHLMKNICGLWNHASTRRILTAYRISIVSQWCGTWLGLPPKWIPGLLKPYLNYITRAHWCKLWRRRNKIQREFNWGLNQDLLTSYYIDALFSSCFLPMQSLITVEHGSLFDLSGQSFMSTGVGLSGLRNWTSDRERGYMDVVWLQRHRSEYCTLWQLL